MCVGEGVTEKIAEMEYGAAGDRLPLMMYHILSCVPGYGLTSMNPSVEMKW